MFQNVHIATCPFCIERIGRSPSSNELQRIVQALKIKPTILSSIYHNADVPSRFIRYVSNKVIIIIMVIFKCYYSGELIALS